MADTDTSLYHIFRGEPDKEPRWLGSVKGLGTAMQEMVKLAAEKPDSYFVFSVRSRKVAASISTKTGAERLRQNNRSHDSISSDAMGEAPGQH